MSYPSNSGANREGMTWPEWLSAATFGTKYSNLSHVEKIMRIPDSEYDVYQDAWYAGEDPTEYAGR